MEVYNYRVIHKYGHVWTRAPYEKYWTSRRRVQYVAYGALVHTWPYFVNNPIIISAVTVHSE